MLAGVIDPEYEREIGLLIHNKGKWSMPVSVRSSCYNKIPWIGWLINKRHLLLTGLEAGSLRSRCQQDSASGENALPVHHASVSFSGRRIKREGSLGSLLMRALTS